MIGNEAPEKAKEWRKALRARVDSKMNVTFALRNEPEDLIEDVSARIAIETEMEAEDEAMDDMDEDSE